MSHLAVTAFAEQKIRVVRLAETFYVRGDSGMSMASLEATQMCFECFDINIRRRAFEEHAN